MINASAAAPFDPGSSQNPQWVFLVENDSGLIQLQSTAVFLDYPAQRFTAITDLQPLIHSDDQEAAAGLFTGQQESASFRLLTAAGDWLWLHGRSFCMNAPPMAENAGGEKLVVMLRAVQPHSIIHLHTPRAEQALLEQILQTHAVASFLEQINAGLTLGEVLSSACVEITRSLKAAYSIVLLYDPTQKLLNVARYHTTNPHDPGSYTQSIPRAVYDAARQQLGNLIVIPDAHLFPGLVAEELRPLVDVRSLVLVPIEQQSELLGVLVLVSTDLPREFTEQELALAEAFAHQLSEVIIHARLLTLAQRQARQLGLLNHIARHALKSSSLQEMLDNLVCHITEHLKAEGCMVLLWNEALEQIQPVSGCGLFTQEILSMNLSQDDLSWTVDILKAGQIAYFEDLLQYIKPNVQSQIPAGFKMPSAVMAMPLRINQQWLGVLFAGFTPPHPLFSSEDLGSWQEVADQVALAIEKLKLLEQEQQRRIEAETLQRATAALTGRLDLAQVLDNILTCLGTVMPMDAASIVMLEEEGMRIVASYGLPDWFANLYEGPLIPDGFGLYGLLKDAGEPVLLNDALPYYPDSLGPPDHPRPLSWMGVRLVAFGKKIGYLGIGSWKKNAFRPANARQLQLLAQQAAIAINNARLFEEVRQGHEQMAALSMRLVEVQEEERRTLARELHDEIGQVLTGLAYTIEMSRRLEGEALHKILLEAQDLLAHLTQQVREMSLNLRPSVLDDLGLQVALEWLVTRFQQQTGIEIDFVSQLLPDKLNSSIAITAFRVVQEALTNCARHAQVKEISVWAIISNNELVIQVEDHGQGFDTRLIVDRHNSSGLTGMRERVRLVGGRFQVLSKPGQGTQVMAVLPVR